MRVSRENVKNWIHNYAIMSENYFFFPGPISIPVRDRLMVLNKMLAATKKILGMIILGIDVCVHGDG
jgi:hypothetical protein